MIYFGTNEEYNLLEDLEKSLSLIEIILKDMDDKIENTK